MAIRNFNPGAIIMKPGVYCEDPTKMIRPVKEIIISKEEIMKRTEHWGPGHGEWVYFDFRGLLNKEDKFLTVRIEGIKFPALENYEVKQDIRTLAIKMFKPETGDLEIKANHNHVTRDIKPVGECPACDAYHFSQLIKEENKEDGER